MKFKASLITLALLGVFATAQAAPSLQTCSPMEVSHNGNNGLSYSMTCEAGTWKMSYAGSVPAGTSEVLAKYRLSVTGDRGENFTHNRQVRLPEPALLGQVLLREAVLLDNGDLALRACDPIGCTLYRPLGSSKASLTEATITGAQEIIRLKREVLRLDELAVSRGDELAKAKADLVDRQAAVTRLQGELAQVSDRLASLEQKTSAERTQLASQLTRANAERDEALQTVEKVKEATAAAQASALAAQHATAMPAPTAAPAPNPSAPEAQRISPERELAAILSLDTQMAAKYESLKLEHEDTLAKLERAQNEAALASARLETLKLTQSLTAQNLSIAHAELDSVRYELAQLKKAAASNSTIPHDAPAPAAACALPAQAQTQASPVQELKAGDSKDALIGRVTEALVNSNTEIMALKAELERAKRPANKPRK